MISFNEINCITESVIFNEKDIYYNKDKFDSGEINLCFITGHSGSGKSTMARNMAGNEIEIYELDDLVWNKMKFTMDNMREYGDLFYSFFNGPGKKYWYTEEEVKEGKVKPVGDNYEELLINDFIKYAMNYTKGKKKKYIIEGVWLVDFCKPEIFKDYAFYIKGTSLLISRWRAAKRDSQDAPKGKKLFERIHNFTSLQLLKNNYDFEKDLNKFVKYFKNLSKSENITESFMSAYKNNMVLYHLSETNLDGKVLKPRIPSNFLVDNGYEDNTTRRVCFSNSISGALAAMSKNIEGKEFYVHSPIDGVECKTPSNKEVPDVNITKERWVLSDVKVKCIGKIKVGTAKDKPLKYKYGNKIAELYYWNYEWIKNPDKKIINRD